MMNEPKVIWWPHWEDKYIPSIYGLRKAFESSLANLSDGMPEAEEYLRSTEGADVPDEVANDAWNTAGDIQEHFSSVRQSMLSVMCVGLWHLLEQQILEIYRQRHLTDPERIKATSNHDAYHKQFNIENFKKRLKQQNDNWELEKLPSWPKLHELCLVANTAKHCFGHSADALFKIRPDLFEEPIGILSIAYFKDKLELSLFVTDNDLTEYFNAAEAFWPEFSEMIKPEG